MKKMRFATLILAFGFIVGSIAGPLSVRPETECATTCDGSVKFDYEVGTTYEYEYEADTVTALRSDGKDSSRLRIRATAEVTPITKCDFSLRLRDVRLQHPRSDGSDGLPVADETDFRLALERSSLRFAFADGHVQHVCPTGTEEEAIWVLNIKRGAISMFQNTMRDFQRDETISETDVTGQCQTRYSMGPAGWLSGEITVRKIKDLSDCSRRTDHFTSLQFNPYHPQIARKSEALVKSSHQCEQKIKHGVLIAGECSESHAFQPFSSQETGAVTNATQKLRFVRTEKSKSTLENEFVQSRLPLSFDHKYKEFGKNGETQRAQEALLELCVASRDDIRPEVPRLFSSLVHRLQELKTAQLYDIYKNLDKICSGNTKAKKLFFDAVPLTGSEAGVELMRDLILRKEISIPEVDTWMLMLGFFPRPTKQMIASLMPLLDPSVVRPKTLLGISTLTHSYCKNHLDCQQEPEIRNLVKHLSARLGEKCVSVGEEEKEKMAVTLKALGNIGFIKDALPILRRCFQTTQNPIEIRLAAIDALRRLPCAIDKDELLSTFLNLEEDSEVRIAAYLSIMKCPTPEIVSRIHDSLETEVVNQVGSFVWTHLTSVQETSDPCKRDIKKILSSKKLQKKFSTDVRKFSRYYEGSLYLDSMKTGSHVDGTVVFSPDSYLPRSSSLGLTLDIFGESINLFEVGGRAEGFEHLVESFFGPKGYFPDDTIQRILESARNKESYNQTKLNEIASIFNVKHSSEKEPSGSLYMRVFGNDLLYTQFANFEQLIQRANPIDAMGTLMRLLQNEEAEYTKSFVLMDSTLILPTAAGLPLNLTLNGTAAINLRAGGKLDLSRMRSNSFHVRAHLQPSASVEIASSMVVDAFVAQSGLKMVATAHTSIQADGELTVNGGELVKARINMPKDKLDIFDIDSRVYLIGEGQEQPRAILGPQRNQATACSGEGVSKYLGVEMCAEMEFPDAGNSEQRPAFLFAGPVSARAFLRKTDKTMESYNFEYRWDKQPVISKTGSTQYVRKGLLLLDTPKSTVNRQLKAEFNYNEPDNTLSLEFVSPIQQLSISGQLNNEPEMKKLKLTVLSNWREQLDILSELKVEKDRLVPRFTVRVGGRPAADFSAQAMRKDNRYSVEMALAHLTRQPITFKGAFGRSNNGSSKRYDLDFTLNSSPLYTFSKWFLQVGDSSLATKGTVEYKVGEQGQKQFATFSGKCQHGGHANVSVALDFQNTAIPAANWDAVLDVRRSPITGSAEATLTLTSGPTDDSTRFLDIRYQRQWSNRWPEHNLTSSLRVQFPAASIDVTGELKSQLADNRLDSSITLKYKPKKQLSLVGRIQRGATPTEIVSGFVQLSSSSSPSLGAMKLSGSLTRPQPKELVADASYRWSEEAEAKATITLRKTSETTLGHDIYAEFRLPGQAPILLKGDVMMDKTKSRAHGQAQLNGAIYSTFAEYHKPSVDNVRVLVGTASPHSAYNAEVELQNAKNDKYFTTTFDMGADHRVSTDIRIKRDKNRATASAELKMNDSTHPEDTYNIQMDLHKPVTGSEGVVTLHCPSRTVGVKWNFTNDFSFNQISPSAHHQGRYEAWWDVDSRVTADLEFNVLSRRSSRDVSGSILISTPLYGLREVAVKAEHNDDGIRWKNSGAVRMNGESALSLVSDGKFLVSEDKRNVQATINLESEIMAPGMMLNIELNHELDGKEAKNILAVKWAADRQIEIILRTADHSGPLRSDINYSGRMNVTTPFEYLKDLSVAAKVTNKDKVVVQLEIDRGNTHIAIDLQGKIFVDDKKTDAYFGVNLQTPFAGFEDLSTSLRLAKDEGASLTAALDFGWKKDKRIAMEATVVHQAAVERRHSALSLHLLSPFQHLEDVLLTVSNERKQNQLHYQLEAKWSPEDSLLTSLDYNVNLPNDAYVKVDIREPFHLFDRFSTEMQYSYSGLHLNLLAMGLLGSDKAKLSYTLTKEILADQSDHTYHALINIITPFEALKNVLIKVEHTCLYTVGKHVSDIDYNVNGKQGTISHLIRASSLFDFDHQFLITLPLETVKRIKLYNQQTRDGNNYMHKSEISWSPNNTYTLVKNTNLQMETNKYVVETDVQLGTPAGSYGPFRSLLSHETVTKQEGRSRVTIEYWPGSKIDLVSNVKVSSTNGNAHLALTTPFSPAKSVIFDGEYNIQNNRKSGSINVQWREGRNINLVVVAKHNDRDIQTDVSLDTPWQMYEKNSLRFTLGGDGSHKRGKITIGLGQRVFEATVDSKKNEGNGEYIVTLTSPLDGLESTTLICSYGTFPADKSLTVTAESSLGKIEINTFHNIRANSMDSGVTLKSPIAGIEHLIIGSHFDGNANGREASINIESGEFKADISAKYGQASEGGYFNLALNTPSYQFKAIRFDSKYALASNRASLSVSASLNGRKSELNAKTEGNASEGKVALTLTTPFDGLKSLSFVGQLNISDTIKSGALTVSMDDQRATLSARVTPSATGLGLGLEFSGPIEYAKSFKMLAHYKLEGNAFETSIVTEREFRTFDFSLKSSLHPHFGDMSVVIKSPLADYALSGVTFSYDLQKAKKEIKFTLRKDGMSANVEGELETTKNGVDVKIQATTSVHDYETLLLSLKSNVDNGKHIYSFMSQKGLSKYQLTWELTSTRGHLASNVVLKTPEEDSMLYTQYNFNGANSINFDAKLIKQKTMIELSGRFWRHPDSKKADASVLFNSNFKRMIAASASAHFDMSGKNKELKFQTEFNGQRNEIAASKRMTADGHDLLISGITTHPDWKTFSIVGNVSDGNADKFVKLIVKKNDKEMAITASMLERTTLQITTSISGFESLLVKVYNEKIAAGERMKILVIQGENVLIDISGSRVRQGAQLATNLTVASGLTAFKGFTMKTLFSSEEATADIASISSDRRIHVEVRGRAGGDKGDINAIVESNFDLPYVDVRKGEFAIKYDGEKHYLIASAELDQQVYKLNIGIQEQSAELLFDSPATSEIKIDARYEKSATDRHVTFQIRSKTESLGTFQVDVDPNRGKIQFHLNSKEFPLKGSAEYSIENARRSLLISIGESGSVLEINAYGIVNRDGEPTFETQFTFTSSVVRSLEHLQFYSLINSKDGLSSVTSIKWAAADKEIKLVLDFLPKSSGIIAATLSTPFIGYERMSLTVNRKVSDAEYAAGLSVEWASRKMAMQMALKAGKMNISLSCPFFGMEDVAAFVVYGADPMKASIQLKLNPITKMEIKAEANLNPYNGMWLLILNIPIIGHGRFAFRGDYDFLDHPLAHIYAVGNNEKFEVTMTSEKGSTNDDSRQLLISVLTSVEQFHRLIVKAKYALSESQKGADVFIQFNNREFQFSGTKIGTDKDVSLNAQMVTPISGYEIINVDAKYQLVGRQKATSVNVQKNGKSVMSFSGSARINLPSSVTIDLKLDGASAQYSNAALAVKFERANDEGKLLANVAWGTNKIELEAVLDRLSLGLTLYSPFSIMSSIQARGKMLSDSKHFGLHSSLSVDSKKFQFDFDVKNQLPRNIEASVKLNSPFETLPELSSTLSYRNAGNRLVHSRFTIDTPFPSLPKIELKFDLHNDNLEKINATANLQWAQLAYSVEGSLDDDRAGNVNTKITVRTPHSKFSTITLTGTSFHQGLARNKVSVNLSLPTTQHSVSATLLLAPEDMEFNVLAHSSCMEATPASFGVSFVRNSVITKLQIKADTKATERSLNWVVDKSDDTHKGQISYHSTSLETSELNKWTADYLSNAQSLITKDSPIVFYLKISHEPSVRSGPFETVVISLEHSGQTMNAKLNVSYDQQEHYFVTGFSMRGAMIDGSVELSSPMLPFKFSSLKMKLTGKDAALKFVLDKTANTISANYKTKEASYEATFKIEAPTFGINGFQGTAKLGLSRNNVDGVLNIQTQRVSHSLSASYKRSSKDLTMQLKLKTPLYNINNLALNANIVVKDLANVDVTLSAVVRRKAHSILLRYKLDALKFEADFKLRTSLIDINDISIRLQLERDSASSTSGFLAVTTGDTEHSGKFSLASGQQETAGTLELNSPLLSSDPFSLKSSLVRSEGDLKASLIAKISTGTHSIDCKLHRSSNTSQHMQVKLDSSLLQSGSYSILAKSDHKPGRKRSLELTLVTPSDAHSVQCALEKGEKEEFILQGTLTTPLLNIDRVTMTAKVFNVTSSYLKVSLGLETPKHNHQLAVAIQVAKEEFEFDCKIDTTFFNIGTISTNGTITQIDKRTIHVDMLLTTPHHTHAIKGDFKVEANSVFGNFRVETPYWDTIEIEAHMQRVSTSSVQIFFTVKNSEGNSHQLQAQLKREAGSLSTDVKIDSALLPSKQIHLIGNVTLLMPLTFAGNFALLTPDQSVKLSSNYQNKPHHSVEGGLILETSYEAMPMLRMSGRMARPAKSEGYDGEFELHTDNYGDPKVALYYKYEMDGKQLTAATVTVYTPFQGFELLSCKYGWRNDESPKTFLLTFDRDTYGYEAKYTKGSGARNIHLVVFFASKQYMLGVSTQRQADRIQVGATLNTPIKHLQQLSFALLHDKETGKSHTFQMSLSGRDYRYGAQSEFSYTDARNFKEVLTLETPLAGYEKITLKVQQTYADMYWRYSLEQFFQDGPTFALLLENFHRDTEGRGKIQLTTSLDNLKTADAYFRYELDEDMQVEGQAGLSHNGRKLVDINTVRNKAGGRRVEIANPIQPLTLRYTYSVAGETVDVEATLDWLKSDGQVESSIGFEAKIISRGNERLITVRGIHPTRPIVIVFAQTIAEHSFAQSGRFNWADDDVSSVGYEVRTLQSVDADGRRKCNLTTRLSLPIRTFELSTQSQRGEAGARTAALFKWDASRDDNKKVGFAVEHDRIHNNGKIGYRAAAILEHPLLEKEVALRGEMSADRQSDVVFLGRLELDYSRGERQKLSVEAKVTKAPAGGDDDRLSLDFRVAHPVSNTDIRLVSDVANDSRELSGGFKLSYMDRRGQQCHLELRSKIVKLQKKIQFMLESNAAKLQLNAQMRALESGYLLSVASQLNNQLPISAQLQLTRDEGSMADFTVEYDPTNKMRVRAGLSDPKTILMEKYQMIGTERVRDMEFSMRLNDSREVVTTFSWQPGALRQLETELISLLEKTSVASSEWLNDLSSFVGAESADKRKQIAASIRETLRPAIDDLNSEWIALSKDTAHMQLTLHRMYEKNTFYLRDIIDSIIKCPAFQRLCTVMANTAEELIDGVNSAADSLASGLVRLTQLCREASRVGVLHIRDRVQDLPYAILHYTSEVNVFTARAINSAIAGGLHLGRELFFYLVPQLHQWQNSAPEWISRMTNDVTGKLKAYTDSFFGNRYYHQLKSTAEMYVNNVREAFNYEYWTNLWINYSPIFEKITDYALTYLDHPYLNAFSLATENAYNLGVWAYNFLKVEDRVRDLSNMLMARAEDILMYVIQETIVPDYELPSMANRIVFDPEKGRLEIVQRLPVAWNSFTEAPRIYDSPEYHQLVQASGKLGQLPYSSVKNLLHAVKSEFSWTNMVPRFRGRALLVGNQHYMTFDGRAYEFAGDCSYLLAHDFMDNNFTAVVMYKEASSSAAPSFLVILDGRRIVIEPDLRVTLDDQAVQLPLVTGDTRIAVTGDQVVTVSNDERQVWMSYGGRYRVLLLEVGGFYHGKTSGLFGSYDHEPFDDFRTPTRTTVKSVEDFAAAWEVGGGGKCQAAVNRAVAASSENSFAIQKACNELFTGYNTMTPCTRKMNPQPYRNMCVNDVAAGNSPCGAAAAYVTMCRASGYDVSIPEKCLECSVGTKKVHHGEETTLTETEIPRSVDTILVADNSCPNFRRTTLATVARATERSLLAAKITDNRYAVVTFAGHDVDVEAHAVVVDGRTFVDFRSLDAVLNNTRTVRGGGFVGQLIDFAGRLAFRAGVGKTVIVVPCDGQRPDVERQFDRLASQLRDADLILHVASVGAPTFTVGANKVKVNEVLGFDGSEAYTTKSVRRGSASVLQGDAGLRHQVVVADHSLEALALATDGSVFFVGSSNAFTARLATDSFGRRVAQTAAPATCQHCECAQDIYGAPMLRCVRCSSEHVAAQQENVE